MCGFHCRVIEDGDLDAVKALWKDVFRDTDEYVDSFFSTLYMPGTGIAAVSGDEIVSHFFSIPGLRLITPAREYAVSYLAALATSPERRGGGAGAAVAHATVQLAFRQDSELACLMPANEGLYGWYERAIGSKTLFCTREREFSPDSLPTVAGPAPRKIGSAEYGELRERLLAGTLHIRFAGRFLDWIAYEFRSGGLFALGKDICAAVSLEKGFRINELLCPEGDFELAVAALSAHFGAGGGIVRSPAFWGSDERGIIRPTVVAATPPGTKLPEPFNAYWGFAFD